MKLKLTDREWGVFRVGDVFDIEKCLCNNASTLKEGEVPYIGATNRNNGLVRFVEQKEKWVTKGECIVFVSDGQGSCGYSFYKESDFIGSTTLKVGRHSKLNKYNGKFIAASLDMNKEIYSYGYKRTEGRLKNEVIQLPVDALKNPDWDFMAQYIKELELEKVRKYREYAESVLEELEYIKVHELSEKEWRSFKINEICHIYSGIDIYQQERVEGGLPYVTSTALNNGINYFVSNTNRTLAENSISVNRNGAVGYAFYHKYKAIFSNDCRRVELKERMNEFTALFVTNQIMGQKEKYSYGYKMGTGRLEKQDIMLPVDSEGKPDYDFMEQYIKNLMYVKYREYLDFKK